MLWLLLLLAAGLSTAGAGEPSVSATLDITVIDVREGDAVLVEVPARADGERKRMLIDGGDSADPDNALMTVLADKRVKRLDFVVLTHPHSSHYNGLSAVLRARARITSTVSR